MYKRCISLPPFLLCTSPLPFSTVRKLADTLLFTLLFHFRQRYFLSPSSPPRRKLRPIQISHEHGIDVSCLAASHLFFIVPFQVFSHLHSSCPHCLLYWVCFTGLLLPPQSTHCSFFLASLRHCHPQEYLAFARALPGVLRIHITSAQGGNPLRELGLGTVTNGPTQSFCGEAGVSEGEGGF